MARDFISVTGLQILTWCLASFASILSAGRYTLRYHKTGRLHWDDAAHGLAFTFMIAVCGIYSSAFSYARLIDDYALGLTGPPPKAEYIRFLKVQLALSILFWLCIYAVKMAFLLFYRMLFVVSKQSNQIWWGISSFTFLTFWVCIAGELTACGPSRNLFHEKPCQSVRGVNNFHDVLIYSCVVNVFSDLAIMAFPLHKLRSLQVRAAQKTILALIFSLVLFVIAVDVARTVISIKGGAVGAQSAAWGVVEATVAVMTSCLPTYRSLLSSKPRAIAGPQNHKDRSSQRNLVNVQTSIELEVTGEPSRGSTDGSA